MRPRSRIESLSDMIFGLALSVGAITLVSAPPTDVASVINDIATFGFSFMILIGIWLRYTRIMSALPLESTRIVRLNIILLFLVSIEPFLFNLVRRPPQVDNPVLYGNFTSGLYGADLGGLFLIQALFTLTLADEEKKLIPDDLMASYRNESYLLFIGAAFYLISAYPAFYAESVPLFGSVRFALWLAPLILLSIRRGRGRASNLSRQPV